MSHRIRNLRRRLRPTSFALLALGAMAMQVCFAAWSPMAMPADLGMGLAAHDSGSAGHVSHASPEESGSQEISECFGVGCFTEVIVPRSADSPPLMSAPLEIEPPIALFARAARAASFAEFLRPPFPDGRDAPQSQSVVLQVRPLLI